MAVLGASVIAVDTYRTVLGRNVLMSKVKLKKMIASLIQAGPSLLFRADKWLSEIPIEWGHFLVVVVLVY